MPPPHHHHTPTITYSSIPSFIYFTSYSAAPPPFSNTFSLSCTPYCCCTSTIPPSAFCCFTLSLLLPIACALSISIAIHLPASPHSLHSGTPSPLLFSPSLTQLDSPRLKLVHSFLGHCQTGKCRNSLYPLSLSSSSICFTLSLSATLATAHALTLPLKGKYLFYK